MTWIGTQDLNASRRLEDGVGPICSALEARSFDRVVLIANQDAGEVADYVQWLRERTQAEIVLRQVSLESPVDILAIHGIAQSAIRESVDGALDAPQLVFHLSPGTWAMAGVWMILSATQYPAELIQSSPQGGVQSVTLPFDISAEVLPKIFEPADRKLAELNSGSLIDTYGDLIFRSPVMSRLKSRALKAAVRAVPVLIEGEVGTEKTALARAMHTSGPRSGRPFIVFNCRSAEGSDVAEALFGPLDSNGFSGGAFAKAEGGTLFLDEVEALPVHVQAKLQLFLDELSGLEANSGAGSLPDIRIIASSRGRLIDEVAEGSFREELLYALSVLVLKIPPLREREGDLSPLIDALLERINAQSAEEPGFVSRVLSPAAKNALIRRPWPGNIRELESALRRAVVTSDGKQITEDDVLDSVFSRPTPSQQQDEVLGKPIEGGVVLPDIMAEVARHYITRAIEQAEGNKSNAARLVGLPSYQTLSNWMKKYDVV